MSAWSRVSLCVALLVAAIVVCAAGNPLSGATVLAMVLALAALYVLVPVLTPPTTQAVMLEEAVELIDAERREQRRAAQR